MSLQGDFCMENVDIFYTKRGILFRGGLDGFWFAVLSPFFFFVYYLHIFDN